MHMVSLLHARCFHALAVGCECLRISDVRGRGFLYQALGMGVGMVYVCAQILSTMNAFDLQRTCLSCASVALEMAGMVMTAGQLLWERLGIHACCVCVCVCVCMI